MNTHGLAVTLARLAAGLATTVALFAQPAVVRLSAHDARPLAKIADELEHRYGLWINYEDPPYLHSSEVVDLTVPEARAKNPSVRALFPKVVTLDVDLDVDSARTNGA